MMNVSGRRWIRAVGFLLAWAVILFVLAAVVYGVAGDGDLLAREMLRYAPSETTGLPEEHYAGVCRMTAAYLTGGETVFQYSFTDGTGTTRLCFRSYEADHMKDCRELIRLAGTLRWMFGGLALALAGTGFLLRKRGADFAGGMLWGLAAAAVVFGALLLWGLIDFDGLFTAFHRIAFTNEGWLLDARTDLLLRLMPVDFFIALAAKILLWTAAAAIAAFAAARIILRVRKDELR